jgi:hypothetical protein
MTVPRTLRTALQGQSMVCLSRRLQVSKHLSDGPLEMPEGPPGVARASDCEAHAGPCVAELAGARRARNRCL